MPVTILNDEGAVAPPTHLSAFLAEMRDRGVLFVMAIQSLSQARNIFGGIGSDFPTLFRTMVLFRGVKDDDTLKLVSTLNGKYWQDVHSRTYNGEHNGIPGTSIQVGPHETDVLRPDQIAKGHPDWPDAVLVLDAKVDSYWVNAVPYFRDEPWTRLLINGLEHSIEDETLLPLPTLTRDGDKTYLNQLGLTNRFEPHWV